MTNENFYEAAVRHWIDGSILEQQDEYDNAVCMYGFAAECALKKIMERVYSRDNVRSYRHLGETLFEDIRVMTSGDLGLAAVLDPACGLRLSQMTLPDILFKDHPDRRYFGDGMYPKEDARVCGNAVEDLIRKMAEMRLDGYI